MKQLLARIEGKKLVRGLIITALVIATLLFVRVFWRTTYIPPFSEFHPTVYSCSGVMVDLYCYKELGKNVEPDYYIYWESDPARKELWDKSEVREKCLFVCVGKLDFASF